MDGFAVRGWSKSVAFQTLRVGWTAVGTLCMSEDEIRSWNCRAGLEEPGQIDAQA